jgi:hypothetical protein
VNIAGALAFMREYNRAAEPSSELPTFHASDFLTGNPSPSFARATDRRGVVILELERLGDEPYPAFERRAVERAQAAQAARIVFGGIRSVLDENEPYAPWAGPREAFHNDQVQLLVASLHAGQIDALRQLKRGRFNALRCGRRFGKTQLAEALIADAVLLGRNAGYFAPTYALTSPTVAGLAAMFEPVAERINRATMPRVIALPGGGMVEIWSLDNQRVGRSRFYDLACIDEAAHVEGDMCMIFDAAIMPTLLDRRGSALVLSTPNGIDESQWFWRINHIDELGFARYHAPTSANPAMPRDELERLRLAHHPGVFSQEYEGQFVDLSGVALINYDAMLVDGKPVDYPDLAVGFGDEAALRMPRLYDSVFMTVDCTMKGGPEGDASAFLICAFNAHFPGPKGVIILDWYATEAGQGGIDRDFSTVLEQYVAYARRSREGPKGIFIEDTGLGSYLLHEYAGWGATAFDSNWVARGKGPRVIAIIEHINRGEVKVARAAHERRMPLKNTMANHFRTQLLNFRLNDKKMATRADDLVDVFTAAIITAWQKDAQKSMW